MKINIDQKKELFKWGPIKLRLIYPSFFMETLCSYVIKYDSWPWPPNLCIFKDGKGVWIVGDLTLSQVGLKYFKKYFLNLKNYQKHWQKWERWIEEYEETATGLGQLNFKKLTNKELYKYLKDFYDLEIRFWLIVHVPEIANWGGEYLLKNKLEKLFKDRANEYLEILSAPIKLSFFQQEELDLLKIGPIKDKNEKQKALENHTKKYFWILNSYGDNRILKKEYFEKKLKDLLKNSSPKTKIREIKNIIENNKKRKRRLIKKLKLNKEIILIADQLSQSIWWQDLRKGYIWRMNFYLDKFLKEIERRTNWNFSQLVWCWAYELLDILRGKKVNKKDILRRRKYYAFYGERGKIQASSSPELVKSLASIYLPTDTRKVKEIEGLVVSRGKKSRIRGRVKTIKDPFKDNKKMRKGDILVAGMTSPEYIVAMRKAAAIITDHGGMTAHAAIVSRELKVPCIVGTKIATKVLKDGDKVEVDANEGIVRILKNDD